jgi:thiamine-phosphate pyrophosphorylase
MLLVVISPEGEDPREQRLLVALVAAGLERYHVRKPGWSATRLEAWLAELPATVRSRVVLHQHHELAPRLGLAGRHWRDDGTAPARPDRTAGIASRSCHELGTLRDALGHYDAVLLGPVFPSISKPGHGGRRSQEAVDLRLARARAVLASRDAAARRTTVLALGGVTAGAIARCREAGFDGVAALGAVWNCRDPLGAFEDLLRSSVEHHTSPSTPP